MLLAALIAGTLKVSYGIGAIDSANVYVGDAEYATAAMESGSRGDAVRGESGSRDSD